MLRVWGRRSAFNVQKVMWLIGELGIEHEHFPAGGDHGGLDDPAFRAMNPHGKVPVIDDDGIIVWESHAILRYLAATYGAGTYWVKDAASRSWIDRWMDWSATTLQPDFLTGVFWGWYRTPEESRDRATTDLKIAACARHMQQLDYALSARPLLSGEQFGLADIPAGTNPYRYFNIDIDRPDVPRVEDWYARLTERAAYREHVMLPFEHLKGRLSF